MRVRDLRLPVTTTKSNWLPGTTWLGFTPTGKGPDAVQKCESAVVKQLNSGFVLERVTQKFGLPNRGFEDDPEFLEAKEKHSKLQDRLIAIHRLRHSARPLQEIIGEEEFNKLQNIWALNGDRRRWSVAFPIVESYRIIGQPKAHDVFPRHIFDRLYAVRYSLLRELDDNARDVIADLEIEEVHAPNSWIEEEYKALISRESEIYKS